MSQTRYIAVKSRTRTYGYTVQDTRRTTTYFLGPDCTAGWYRLKRDAQHRADVMNEADEAERFGVPATGKGGA